jgi:hypothetical protein
MHHPRNTTHTLEELVRLDSDAAAMIYNINLHPSLQPAEGYASPHTSDIYSGIRADLHPHLSKLINIAGEDYSNRPAFSHFALLKKDTIPLDAFSQMLPSLRTCEETQKRNITDIRSNEAAASSFMCSVEKMK